MLIGRPESFGRKARISENNSEEERITYESDTVAQFWSSLEPTEQHTEHLYHDFLEQIDESRLPLEIKHTLTAWQVPVPSDWEQLFNQSSLDQDGEPDFTTIKAVLPAVGARLENLYKDKLALKIKVKENRFFFNDDGSEGPFGVCETRLLPTAEKKHDTNPIILMPGCLTGAISLENTAVALAQAGYDVASCDTSAPNSKDNKEYHMNNDTEDWTTPRTAVNTAYTKSVEYAMKTYEVGLNMPADQKYNLLGYSTSAAAVLQAALLHPEKVDKIVLLAPIGLNNTEATAYANVIKILINAAKHSKQNVQLGEKTQNAREYFTGYIERQKERGWAEIPAIIWNAAVSDLGESIYEALVEHDIPIAVILGGDDKMFNAEEAETKLDQINDTVDHATADTPFEVAVLDGGYTHNHIGRDPERTALVLDSALDRLGRVDRFEDDLEQLLEQK
jgi:pimeloyl-ACP methyl ester carboxylesterase